MNDNEKKFEEWFSGYCSGGSIKDPCHEAFLAGHAARDAEIKELGEYKEMWQEIGGKANLSNLLKQNEELRECVNWYADEANQIAPVYDPTGKTGADFTQPYRMDSGKRARQVLKYHTETIGKCL